VRDDLRLDRRRRLRHCERSEAIPDWIASPQVLLAITRRGRIAIARDLRADLSTSLRAFAKQSRATEKNEIALSQVLLAMTERATPDQLKIIRF
jgi:hypothetical protein